MPGPIMPDQGPNETVPDYEIENDYMLTPWGSTSPTPAEYQRTNRDRFYVETD